MQISIYNNSRFFLEAGRTFFAKIPPIPEYSNEEVSQPYLYPWLAEIRINDRQRQIINSCTGVLINDKYVLTAQSCVLP